MDRPSGMDTAADRTQQHPNPLIRRQWDDRLLLGDRRHGRASQGTEKI